MALEFPANEFGQRAERRLHDELLAWLTTVRRDGLPQPSPIWYLWDGESFLIYSQPRTQKLRNIAHDRLVSVHLDGNGHGGDIVIVAGEASVDEQQPPADRVPEYVEKYTRLFQRNGWTPTQFAEWYSVPIRVRALGLRGH